MFLISKRSKYDLRKKVEQKFEDYKNYLLSSCISVDEPLNRLKKYVNDKVNYAEFRYTAFLEENKELSDTCKRNFTWDLFNKINRHIHHNERGEYAVLYKLMENGGRFVGPRKGVLFVQEMREQGINLDINIPVSYAIDYKNLSLKDLLEPLLPKLNIKTICPVNYFSKGEKIKEVKLSDALRRLRM